VTELTREQRNEAIASLQQYAERNFPEPIGDLAAGLLLDFFLQEIGPVVYNSAIRDAQTRLQARLSELDGDLYEAPFTYWLKTGKRSR
jgi:uncharacterized protein (DUF2164 family)